MKTIRIALLLCLVLAAAALPAGARDTGPALAHVTVSSEAERDLLLNGRFDLAEVRRGDTYDVVLWPGDHDRLVRAGLTVRLAEPSLPGEQVRAAAVRTNYRTLAEHEADIRWIAETYPAIARLVVAPHRTLEERQVLGVEVAANVAREDGRPTVMIDGLHHAREWPAAELVTDFAMDLAKNYGTDARITTLLNNVRILLVPVVNPDGFAYSRGSLVDEGLLGIVGEGAYWRKNRRGLAHAAGQSAGSYGVDPNRNYGFVWGGGTSGLIESTSAVPIDQTYQGHAPFSEPETMNVRTLALSRNVVTALTNHTYGRLVLYPWGHTSAPPPDYTILRALGRAIATENRYTPQPAIQLYPTTGSSEDWMYATMGTLAYTIESGSSFHPPYLSTYPGTYAANRRGFLVAAEAAMNTAYHSILTGTVRGDGAAVAATLRLTKTVKHQLSSPGSLFATAPDEQVAVTMQTGADGTFTWHVNPSKAPLESAGSYQLRVEAPGYEPFERQVIVARGQSLNLGQIDLLPAS